jgi:hypothetical protein
VRRSISFLGPRGVPQIIVSGKTVMGEFLTKWAYLAFKVSESVEERFFDFAVFDLAQFNETTDFPSRIHAPNQKCKCRKIPFTHDDRHEIGDLPVDVMRSVNLSQAALGNMNADFGGSW